MLPEFPLESPGGLAEFSAALCSDEPALLETLRRRGYQRTLQGRMICGAQQGRLLSLLSSLVSPHKILEIGTFTGYSALCLAEGLAPQGTLETIELNDELFNIQAEFWGQSAYAGQIILRPGIALEVLEGLDENCDGFQPYDLFFIDADKANYPAYIEHAHRLMRSGGLMILDNMWRGGTAHPDLDTYPCKEAQILAELNVHMKNDPRWEVVVLPLRDGLSLCRKV